eukprot:CAMPEP_0175846086 /NCGR_PEP_ID=MMETSP0107_2-20121207/22590_1 /TAXON_ID=195067 ORGANISM="Goniomonas pacifica, Strain CCMP1869" /NCGR_SAMPLE_ID=MMETSP0107_2 /ASSEMBLY_ACC=CAM_ASM_000203 /LENGTH=32 /DNA_ID= /DNA_START= /DNA_END= /DNA_ORIENTATION=
MAMIGPYNLALCLRDAVAEVNAARTQPHGHVG